MEINKMRKFHLVSDERLNEASIPPYSFFYYGPTIVLKNAHSFEHSVNKLSLVLVTVSLEEKSPLSASLIVLYISYIPIS